MFKKIGSFNSLGINFGGDNGNTGTGWEKCHSKSEWTKTSGGGVKIPGAGAGGDSSSSEGHSKEGTCQPLTNNKYNYANPYEIFLRNLIG